MTLTNRMTTDTEKQTTELVIARLQVIPSGVVISVGPNGSFTKEELIEHIKKNDDIGKKIKEIQLEYLRLLKTNVFYV